MEKIHSWQRFWVPAGTELVLDHDAYLPDPQDGYGSYINRSLSRFAELCNLPCIILLGEPGMGKSLCLQADCSALSKTWPSSGEVGALVDLGCVNCLTDLNSVLLDRPDVRNWTSGSHILHLSLDSLDEALPNYSALPKALLRIVASLPRERLRLAIACRAGELPPHLEDGLTEIFGPNGVSTWNMAPLRRRDIQIAAEDSDLDAERFLHSVWDREVQPLAARPITLQLLLKVASSGKKLPSDVWSLYEQGCRELLCERSNSSRFNLLLREDVAKRLAIAGRIACMTIFGAYQAVETEPNATNQVGVLSSDDIGGRLSLAKDNSFEVSTPEILGVLRSGLFAATRLQFRWAHKSYAEFLAAHHLRSKAVTETQKMSLIRCAGQVAPALRGVAAWLTSKDNKLFREVLRVDPEVLLFADLSTATDAQKENLVEWLLKQAQSPLIHEWGMFWNFRKLAHTGLKEQIERVITGSQGQSARHLALEIAYACGGLGLATALADLALREHEPIMLRITAAWIVADHGEPADKIRLVSLAFHRAADEQEERLKVQALSAIFPRHCTWAQLRDHLGTTDQSPLTPLGHFIAYEFPVQIQAADLAEVLEWAAHKNWVSHLSAWATATDRVLARAVPLAEDPTIRKAVVAVLFRRLSEYEGIFSNLAPDKVGPWAESTRRAIAAELMPLFSTNHYGMAAALRCSTPLLEKSDIPWVIERWCKSAGPERSVWENVVGLLTDWRDRREYAPVLRAARRDPDLFMALLAWYRTARLSAKRERLRVAEERTRSEDRRAHRMLSLRELLSRTQSEPGAFGQLLYVMCFPLDQVYGTAEDVTDLERLPGWQPLTEEERARLMVAGRRCVEEERPYSCLGLRRGGISANAAAGYRMLRALTSRDLNYLRSLPLSTWETWAPAIVLYQLDLSDKEYADADRQLLALAAEKVEAHLARVLGIAVRAKQVRWAERAFERIARALRSKTSDVILFRSLCSPRIPQHLYVAGMRHLLERSHPAAMQAVEDAPGAIATAAPDEFPRLALNSALWLEIGRTRAWRCVWKQMRAYPEFARQLLDAPSSMGRIIKCIAEWLPDDKMGQLFVWLRNQFGEGPDGPVLETAPEFQSQSAVLYALQRRGSASAVARLEHLVRLYPKDWQIRKAAWDAQRIFLERTWEPLDSASVKRIIEDRSQLLVRDDKELMEAVMEALRDYQLAIRGEGSQLMRLWNEPTYRPKPEEPLSREIAAELSRILAGRGVMLSLEPRIRDHERVDIYVSGMTADIKRRRVSLIIEVKGCWHEELQTALDTQLAKRYLKDNQSRLGVYLVVWFLCDKWDDADSRKSSTPHRSASAIQKSLEEQALRVRRETQATINAFVLDATFGEPQTKGAKGVGKGARAKGSKRVAKGVRRI